MKLVVDTSILIDHLRKGAKWKQFIDRIDGKEDVELFIPSIVVFEFFSGKSTKILKKQNEIVKLLKKFQKIDLTDKIAKRAGELLRDTRITLDVPDYIIAASAFEINGEVVTLNIKHFQKIPNLNLYSLPQTS